MKFIDFNNIEKIIIKHNKLGNESVKQEAIISIFFSIEYEFLTDKSQLW